MIFKINNNFLEVKNKVKEYDELILGRFSQFEKVSNVKTGNFLRFDNDKVEINLKGKYKILKNRIVKTDIYPIVNNIISFLINDINNMFIHGIVVSKEKKGILILGDFGLGKSTLATEFEKNGYEINSTDQTWIKIENNKVYSKLGSSFDIESGQVKYLDINKCNKNIEIKQIIRIVGICDDGLTNCSLCTNTYHIVKNMSYFCNWSIIMPIFTDDVELYKSDLYTKKFLKELPKTGIKFVNVRGDKKKIIKEVEI